MSRGQIIVAILTFVNAWALMLVKAWLDKRAANASPTINEPITVRRVRLQRKLRWLIALSLAVPVSLVGVILSVMDFGRVSLLLTFLLTVESFVFFTMFFVMYSDISFAANFAEGLSKGFQLSDSTNDVG